MALQPSRALAYLGTHPVTLRKRVFLTRRERVSDVERSPKSRAARPGTRNHAFLPAAAASAFA